MYIHELPPTHILNILLDRATVLDKEDARDLVAWIISAKAELDFFREESDTYESIIRDLEQRLIKCRL